MMGSHLGLALAKEPATKDQVKTAKEMNGLSFMVGVEKKEAEPDL
jgi:hypothetical protein